MAKPIQRSIAAFILSAVVTNVSAYTNKIDDYAAYCRDAGGVVEEMPAEIFAGNSWVKGQSKLFCNFHLHNAFIAVGLETFAADEPSIAATFMKEMGEITSGSPLWKGKYSNPSQNVCKNLGGASIGFITSGGFVNQLGQSDVCVFGDGSMVSGWSLIYMANHREGYDDIKNKVKAPSLNIFIPH